MIHHVVRLSNQLVLVEITTIAHHSMPPLQLFIVPYDSGHREQRMGRGPGALLHAKLDDALRSAGHDVGVEWIESDAAFQTEAGTTFELHRQLATRVESAIA